MRRAVFLYVCMLMIASTTACAAPARVVEPTATVAVAVQPTEPGSGPTAVASEGSTRVQITLADNTIASSLTTFKVGVLYTFIISNHGRHEHNFNISPPVSEAGSIDAALNAALLSVDETQLPQGGSASVDFTFPASAAGAKLELNCLIRRHYEDGMRLEITVTG